MPHIPHQTTLFEVIGTDPPPCDDEPVVVHVHEPHDVYIGRSCHGHTDVGFGNPYVIGTDGDRPTVIADYHTWILTKPELIARIPSLAGKRIACWCRHAATSTPRCHGDVLVDIFRRLRAKMPLRA